MSQAQQLYQLQALDLELQDLERRKSEITGQLGETEALRQAKSDLDAARDRLHREEARVRDLEMDVDQTTDRLKQVQAKLYGGTVRVAKELSNLQRESEHLAQVKSRFEDSLLESMDAVERLQAKLAEAQRGYTALETAWKAEQEALNGKLRETEQAIGRVTAARAQMSRSFSAATLDEYERLRRTRRGRAVARIEQNTCQGCRIGLPMSVVQQARVSPSFVYCPSCGRILCTER